jgi:hypothetical protein
MEIEMAIYNHQSLSYLIENVYMWFKGSVEHLSLNAISACIVIVIFV